MIRITTIILLIFIGFSTTSASDYATISGKAVDAQTGEPLIGANIFIEGTSIGAATDHEGVFTITQIPPGKQILVCSYIGYHAQRKTVTIESGDAITIEFSLRSKLLDVPIIEIIGERIEQIQRIPGSAVVISESKLNAVNPTSANEVFRGVPGINVRDEEGQGLRPNIGIRGLDPTRTRKILMLEDGVPIALAPYGEPEMYYTPPIDRMKRIEILKGSGSILFGPQTVGGVINYITRQPPRETTFSTRFTGGSNDFINGLFSYGGTWNNVGIESMYLHKTGSGFREHSNFTINDLTSQFVFGLSHSSRIGFKLNIYDENANVSYLGLTTPMFEANPYQNPAKHDVMHVRRYAGSVTHQYILSQDVLINTTLYANNTIRNWRRQDYDREDAGREYERIVGDTSTPRGAIYLRNSTGNRNRSFTVYGLEPRVQVNHRLFSIPNELDFGARIHFEDMHILRINGTTPTALSGTIVEDEVRKTEALSGFVQNRFFLNSILSLTSGVRIEHYTFTRNFRRGRNEINQLVDFDLTGVSRSTEVIPGIGFTFQPMEYLTIFAGLHRGFSPPRVQDAIDNTGSNLELEAERSWNYEAGIRTNPSAWLYGELTLYYLDFQNQIIPASEAGGIDTRLINAGETVHRGIESTVGMDVGRMIGATFNLNIEASITLSDAKFVGGIYNGNRLPHAPEKLYNLSVTYFSPMGLELMIRGHHISEQFTDRANTIEASTDGEIGLIDAYTIWDVSANYNLPWMNARIYSTVKNVFNSVYIASRAPRGIFPGPFRQVNIGVSFEI